MNSNSSKGPKVPNPESLIAVLALRNVDQDDVRAGVYRCPMGDYWRAEFRRVNQITGPASRLTVREAFELVTQLRAAIRPGMNVWNEALEAFESDFEVLAGRDCVAAEVAETSGTGDESDASELVKLGNMIVDQAAERFMENPENGPFLLRARKTTGEPVWAIARRCILNDLEAHFESKRAPRPCRRRSNHPGRN